MNGRITRYSRYFPFTPFNWLRTGFDKLRANGGLDQSFLNASAVLSLTPAVRPRKIPAHAPAYPLSILIY